MIDAVQENPRDLTANRMDEPQVDDAPATTIVVRERCPADPDQAGVWCAWEGAD